TKEQVCRFLAELKAKNGADLSEQNCSIKKGKAQKENLTKLNIKTKPTGLESKLEARKLN
ncbi:9922_t:CDS:2, partial [Entrophospora sp. SA101]